MIIGSNKTVEQTKQNKPAKKDKQIKAEPEDKVIISGDSEEKKPEKIYLEVKTRGPLANPYASCGGPLKTRTYRVRNIEKHGDDNYTVKILTNREIIYDHEERERGTWLVTKSGRPLTAEEAARRMKIDFDKPEENPTPPAVIPQQPSSEEVSKRVYLEIKLRGSVYNPLASLRTFMTRHYRVRNIERKDDGTFSVTIGKNQKIDYNHEAMKEGTWLADYYGKPLLGQEAAKIMGIEL